jgi:hypothetical protein
MSSGPIRRSRKVKWCDFLRGRGEDDGMMPVFLFAEGRGSTFDLQAGGWDRPRPTDADLVGYIRDAIQDPALGKVEMRDLIGRDYVAMEWRDRRHFWTAMEAFLAHGIAVSPQCRLTGFWFQPSVLVRPWTPLAAEHALVRTTRERAASASFPYTSSMAGNICYEHPAAWLTREGEDLVRWVRAQEKMRPEPSSSDEELPLDQLGDEEMARVVEEVKALAPTLPPSVEEKKPNEEVKVVVAPAEDEVVCVVCLERPADTLVLPCEHQVCCRACSQQLQDTPNAHVCVVCRRPITSILMDGGA